ncbi:MAG: septation protein IspZ [Bdellovibrionota bacterium]
MKFIFLNFGAPVAFFLVFQAFGAKPAIAVALLVTMIQALSFVALSERISPFFLVASGFTLLFGLMDLFIATPRFFRLEPAVENAVLGAVFGATLFLRIPIAEWFAGALPVEYRPKLGPDGHHYLRKLSALWTIYFWLKAAIYLDLAFRVDLGRLVLLRTALGGGSAVLLLGGEIAYRRLRS